MTKARLLLVATSALLGMGHFASAQAQQNEMTFFVTSAGIGKGADLGGLDGADKTTSPI